MFYGISMNLPDLAISILPNFDEIDSVSLPAIFMDLYRDEGHSSLLMNLAQN